MPGALRLESAGKSRVYFLGVVVVIAHIDLLHTQVSKREDFTAVSVLRGGVLTAGRVAFVLAGRGQARICACLSRFVW